MYLDVLRWIFEGQEHVTISAALRRSLPHLEKYRFTVFFVFLNFRFPRARARARALSPRATTFTIRSTLLVTEKARWPSERDGDKAEREERKRRRYFPLLFPSPSIPQHPARHDDEDGDSARRGVARRGVAWRGAARRGAARRIKAASATSGRTFTKVSTALLATSKSVGRPPK